MKIDAFAAVLMVYSLLTMGSIVTLYVSFRNGMDTSGRLFFYSEILKLPMIGLIVSGSVFPEYRTLLVFVLGNAAYVLSETLVGLSLYVLTRPIGRGRILGVSACGLAVSLFIESFRSSHPDWPVLFYPIVFLGISSAAYAICRFCRDADLSKNVFWVLLTRLETILMVIWSMRIVASLMGAPVTPTRDGALNVALVAVMAAINVFRYIFYQSVRMTWVPADVVQENILNRQLVRSYREKNALLHKLMAANRVLGVSSLASSLAHQLSQPLTGIALQTEVVRRDLVRAKGDEASIARLDRIAFELGKVSALVHSLRRLFAAPDEPKGAFDLKTACSQIVELARASEKGKGVALAERYEGDLRICGDELQIQQVLVNVIDNALDSVAYGARGTPSIGVAITRSDDSVTVTVEDSGGGIAPELLPRIFELYETTKSDGLGIGLWLCREIVRRHGGEITAGDRPAGGAVFLIRLPAGRPAA